MDILELNLANFRNFSRKKIVFDKKLTVIIGPNGVGKSNILEALGLLCAIKSEKAESDVDLVKFGRETAKIEAITSLNEKKNLTIAIKIEESRAKKAYFIDSIKKTLGNFAQEFLIVVFHPADLELVSGSPSLRRKHLDFLLSSVSRDYWRNLSSFGKVISRRNKVLFRISEGSAKVNELDFWDGRLIVHGNFLSRARQDFFEFLNLPSFSDISKSKPLADISWELKQSLISEEKLYKNRERDIAAGITLSGPQRDDFRFMMHSHDLEYFGSRGEQRMAVLALKIAELEFFQIKKATRPILALDDIFSELDWEHRKAVLEVIGKQQTIITAAEKESIPKQLFKKANIIEL